MSRRSLGKVLPALVAAARSASSTASVAVWKGAINSAIPTLGSLAGINLRSLHSSGLLHDVAAPPEASSLPQNYEPPRKFRSLADKELWHEAWMYEDKFGTEDDPIIVPSLEPERIIGCTDPEDDNLVVWGILKANEPPRQFIEGGEFYVLKIVPYVMKVGDVLEQIEGSTATPITK